MRGGISNMERPQGGPSTPYESYLSASSAPRVLTSTVEVRALRAKYPDRTLTIVNSTPNSLYSGGCNIVGFANANPEVARVVPAPDESESILETVFVPPGRRWGDDDKGTFGQVVQFAAYEVDFMSRKRRFLLYVVYCHDGYMSSRMNFILGEAGSKKAAGGDEVDADAEELVRAATMWGIESHNEVWVFDRGMWQKDKELWKRIQKSSWDDVILDKEKKKALVDDVDGFFDGEESYKKFAVPWKRGLIFYGPPGNGKTISVKALMNTLSQRRDPSIEILYVKTFTSVFGPEYSIMSIFQKARQMAPCMLIFEDIDSMVTIPIRSYFLNAVDGLESNHGILMIGSTNHLERLDPGIAKRPSRFDRKYFFDLPTRDERVQYCEYWRQKLRSNKKVDFPPVLCGMIADITDKFSFAYMKEAFVAALLAIVAVTQEEGTYLGSRGSESDREKAEKTLLWKEIKKQVKVLRDEMEDNALKEAWGGAKVDEVENRLMLGGSLPPTAVQDVTPMELRPRMDMASWPGMGMGMEMEPRCN